MAALSAAAVLAPGAAAAGADVERAMLCLAQKGQDAQMPKAVDGEAVGGVLDTASRRAAELEQEIGPIAAQLARIRIQDGLSSEDYARLAQQIHPMGRQLDMALAEIDCWKTVLAWRPAADAPVKGVGALQKGQLLGDARINQRLFAAREAEANRLKRDVLRKQVDLTAADLAARQQQAEDAEAEGEGQE